MFGSQKTWEKNVREKIEKKSRMKENKFKINKLFYILLQIHLTYFSSSI